MSSDSCSHNCGGCGEDCGDRDPASLKEKPHHMSNIKKVIGIVSGKGGVGKSLVTSLMAVLAKRKGFSSAILDADITGPSIPRAFGIHEKPAGSPMGLLPAYSKTGIPVMSLNLIVEEETDPVVWRGPVVAGVVKQFWTDVVWKDIDYMFIDMPPGTGDVPLTVYQSLPIDGIVIVASPQELVGMIVEKAVKMADMMNVPVLGLVENMSYFSCPDCGKEIKVFGESNIDNIAKKYNIDNVARIPIDPKIASLCDNGKIEEYEFGFLDKLAENIIK